MYRVCNLTIFIQYLLDKFHKIIFLIRNAEVCADGECIWIDTGSEEGSYEYEHKAYGYG